MANALASVLDRLVRAARHDLGPPITVFDFIRSPARRHIRERQRALVRQLREEDAPETRSREGGDLMRRLTYRVVLPALAVLALIAAGPAAADAPTKESSTVTFGPFVDDEPSETLSPRALVREAAGGPSEDESSERREEK
jgi:hypothetical protein